MLRFILRRLGAGLINLFVFATVLFFIAQILIPGDFVSQFAEAYQSQAERQAALQQMRENLGLARPLYVQYFDWISHLARGNLGHSYWGQPVTALVAQFLPPTLIVFLTGTLIAFFIGQWLGKLTAWRMPRLLRGSLIFGAVSLYTSFPPWLAFLVVYALGLHIGLTSAGSGVRLNDPYAVLQKSWSKAGFTLDPSLVMLRMLLVMILVALIVFVLNEMERRRARTWRMPGWLFALLLAAGSLAGWFLVGIGPMAMLVAKAAALPILTYTLLSFGETMLIMRTNMADTKYEDYILAARAKGLPEHVVRDKHAARNALLPVLSNFVVSLPYLLTGIVILEQAVNWPGMGNALFRSMASQDMPVVMGMLVIVGLVSMLARLILDLASFVLDPRIRTRQTFSGGFE
jgi:peptide/nickel transport system permease protein